jgi:dolichol-phosphate mannosyltransferase
LHGETHYFLRDMIGLAFDAVTSFSIVPLRLALYIGCVCGLAAMGLRAYTLWSWASGNAVTGWPSVMVTTLMLGSIQLILLGLMGEYLGRMYLEAKQRPLVLMDEVRSASLGTEAQRPVQRDGTLPRHDFR